MLSSSLSLPRHAPHRLLPSFPTRRSSDLTVQHPGVPPAGHQRPRGALVQRDPVTEAGAQQTLAGLLLEVVQVDRKSTRLNSSHVSISYAVFCLKKKNKINITRDNRITEYA